jgi:hypothetical protein
MMSRELRHEAVMVERCEHSRTLYAYWIHEEMAVRGVVPAKCPPTVQYTHRTCEAASRLELPDALRDHYG